MALYHAAAYTLVPETPIPADAAPAVGIDETGQGDALAAASQQYAPEAKIDVTVAEPSERYVEVTLAPVTDLVEFYEIQWSWGDGQAATGHDLVQGHQYALPGGYDITATIYQAGRTSITLSISYATAEPVVTP